MADRLEYLRGSFGTSDNVVSFAYNQANGDPWHRMGTALDGNSTLAGMLAASHCDRLIEMAPLTVVLPSGAELVVPNKRAAVLKGKSIVMPDPIEGFTTVEVPDKVVGVHSDNWMPHQHEDVARYLEVAMDLYNADPTIIEQGGAHWDTMGLLCDGAFFFGNLLLPPAVIDPNGIADKVLRRFYVRTGHDGTQATEGGGKAQREVCWNTVTSGARSQMFKIKHTSRSEDRIRQAIKAVETERDWWASFTEQATKLLSIDDASGTLFAKTLDKFVPMPDELGRGLTLAENKRTDLWAIYQSDTNSAKYGKNGWSIYNALVEYLDWSLPVRGAGTDANARTALRMEQQIIGTQDAAKNRVADYLLATAS